MIKLVVVYQRLVPCYIPEMQFIRTGCQQIGVKNFPKIRQAFDKLIDVVEFSSPVQRVRRHPFESKQRRNGEQPV